MQVSGEGGAVRLYKNSWHCARVIIRNEGLRGFYTGLSASLARQVTYSSVRLGLYNIMLDGLTSKNSQMPSFATKAALGATAGGIGAFVGTPADVAMVRMCVDNRLPRNERRNYKSVFDAWRRIVKEEGVTTLWTGCVATVYRAMVVNVCTLCCQTQAKQEIHERFQVPYGYKLSFMGSTIAGLITSIVSLPVDIAKTRLQNMSYFNGKPEYRGVVDVIVRTRRLEGVSALWKGFTPYAARTGPQTVFTLMLMDAFLANYHSLF